MENIETKDEPQTELVALNNVDLFAAHLVAWHKRKVAMLQHMLDIPDGSEFTVNIDSVEQTVILTGDALVAFRGGLATALMELGTLPFVAMAVPAEEAGATSAPGCPDLG